MRLKLIQRGQLLGLEHCFREKKKSIAAAFILTSAILKWLWENDLAFGHEAGRQLLASPLSPIAREELHENPCESSEAAGATAKRKNPAFATQKTIMGRLMTDMASDKDGLGHF